MKFKKGDYFFTEIGDIYELTGVNDSEEFILIRSGSWISLYKVDYNDLYKTPFYLRREGKYYFCSYENLFKFNKVHREFDEIARSIADGIIATVGKTVTASSDVSDPYEGLYENENRMTEPAPRCVCDMLYRVQVGAFSQIDSTANIVTCKCGQDIANRHISTCRYGSNSITIGVENCNR